MVSPKEARRYSAISNKNNFNFFFFRRAHLKDCFDNLKAEVPCQRDRKITNLQVLNLAIKYIQVNISLFIIINKYLIGFFL